MKSLVREHVARWDTKAVAVGCSGNFTVERVTADLVTELHGNDVNCYSVTLGRFLAGRALPYTLAPQVGEEIPWLADYLDDGVGTCATVMLGTGQTSFLKAVGKDSAYYRRVLEGTQRQFPHMHSRTVDKLNAITLRLASFGDSDVLDWLRDDVPRDMPVVCFPPFFSGDYSSQFKTISEAFLWDEPTFREMGEEAKDELVDLLIDRPAWFVGLHEPREALRPFLRGLVQTTNRGVPIYCYASGGRTRVVAPHQSTEIVPNRRIAPGEKLGEKLSLAVLSAGQFATLRSQYMSHKIRPGQPDVAVAVLCDGVVLGAFAVGKSTVGPGWAYGLSDFCVSGSSYPRLSKLIVFAMLSKESMLLLQRRAPTKFTMLRTTAYTNGNAVSMKYGRGVTIPGRTKMRMELREDAKPGDPGETRLSYVAEYGRFSLDEGYAVWRDKHGLFREAT